MALLNAPAMDFDSDGDVDTVDYAAMAACLSGPGGNVPPACEVFDGDSDGDVDLADYRAFQEQLTGCQHSDPAWPNVAIPAQAGTLAVEFDTVPNDWDMDGLTGLSEGVGDSFYDSAVTVRFNIDGYIDAWDAATGWYAAAQYVPYTPGVNYRVRMDIDVARRLYDVYVTPEGGTEAIIGEDFQFRAQAGAVTELDHWHAWSDIGSHEVCNFALVGQVNLPPAVDAGADRVLALPEDTLTLTGAITDDGLPSPPGATSAFWSLVSGPASVQLTSPGSTSTQATFFVPGTYVLRLAADDGEWSATDDVTVTVAAEDNPAIGLDAAALDFGDAITTDVLNVWNAGSSTLYYTVDDNADWLTVSPAAGTSTGETDALVVTVNRAGLGDGAYEATITVSASGASPETVPVTMTVGSSLSMWTASRTSGTAPLAVFFDAVESASGVVQPSDGDYAAMHYAWSFGDPGSGDWTTSGRSRNTATGYVAGHVFEFPGVYPVTLKVTTSTGAVYTYRQEITVNAFSGTTYYVAANGSDGNSGTSSGAPLRSFATAMNKAGDNVRILFRRGDVFNVGGAALLDVPGTGIVGAYGNAGDPRPILRRTGTSDIFKLRASGWRLMDLDLDGTNNIGEGAGLNVGTDNHRYNLVYRVTVRGFYMGIWNTFYPTPIGHDHVFIVDSEISGQGNKGVFLGGRRIVVMGNYCHGQGSHIVRVWHAIKTIISENTLHDPTSNNAAAIKLHNADNVGGLPDGEFVIIADNCIRGRAAWDVTVGTQDGESYEVMHDVVIERNLIEAHSQLQLGVRINAADVTFRNNVGNLSGTDVTPALVQVTQWGIAPQPTGARIYNNCVYRSDPGTVYLCSDAWSDTLVYNNIAYAASGTEIVCGLRGILSNNITQNPLWVNPGASDFRLQSNSPAIDAGIDVPVYDDYEGDPRPLDGSGKGALYDVGAIEFAP